jgi:hypothetical protein
MAHDTEHNEQVSDAMDYAQHNYTWNVFTQLVKWGVITCAVLMVILYFLINP